MYGNPGDYAFGRAGLDAIITQLLNQMDGTGPPPMAKDRIAQIPTVAIDQQQVGKPIFQSILLIVCHKFLICLYFFVYRTKFTVFSVLGRL